MLIQACQKSVLLPLLFMLRIPLDPKGNRIQSCIPSCHQRRYEYSFFVDMKVVFCRTWCVLYNTIEVSKLPTKVQKSVCRKKIGKHCCAWQLFNNSHLFNKLGYKSLCSETYRLFIYFPNSF